MELLLSLTTSESSPMKIVLFIMALAIMGLLFAPVNAVDSKFAQEKNIKCGTSILPASLSASQHNTDQLYARQDLKKIDRSLIEPAYKNQPRYCLLVFGDSPFTKIWLVEDGENILVDRNATGDITDVTKLNSPTTRSESLVAEGDKNVPYKTLTYELGDIMPKGSTIKHTRLNVIRYQIGVAPPAYVVSVWVNGTLQQYAGWGPLFTEKRDNASVVHFGAPVEPLLLRIKNISKAAGEVELSFCLGTPGIGKHSLAFVGYESVPKEIKTEVLISWPSTGDVFKETLILPGRC